MTTQLADVDYVILLVYLGATVALGLYIGRRIRTGTDFTYVVMPVNLSSG